MARIVLISGHQPDPVRQDYDYRAQGTDAFDRCIRKQREHQIRRLLPNTSALGLPDTAKAIRGGWKKLAAIQSASAESDLIVWHDADAVPADGGQASLMPRVIVDDRFYTTYN